MSADTDFRNVPHVVVAFRAGFPEISPYNKVFSALKASGGIAAEIHPRIAPAAGEIIVAKRRVSAFMGTDLDMILRSNGIHTLVMCGVVTSGVVLSTLCHAADSDYGLLVLRDCCSDIDQSAHALLVEKVFPRHATILTFDRADPYSEGLTRGRRVVRPSLEEGRISIACRSAYS
jgi:nicotinamidase-related amidase